MAVKGKHLKLGFDPSKIVIESDHYVLGALAPVVLKEDGDWSKYLPDLELQYNPGFDTNNCTGFGSTNCVETLQNFLGEKFNYSDRFVGIVAGTRPPGNSPHVVLEAIRKNGLIPETMLPFGKDLNSIDDYFSYKGADQNICVGEGYAWLANYAFGHEWLPSPLHEDIASALKFSPVGLSVTAWFQKDGLYVDNGLPNCHWCMAFRSYPDGRIDVFDSYDQDIKTLSPDHKIQFAKRISIVSKKKIISDLNDYHAENHYLVMVRKVWKFIIDILKKCF